MKIRFLLFGMLALICTVSYSQNKEKHEERSEKLKSQKIAYITTSLDLSIEESEKFWPVYNKYQNDLKGLRDKDRGHKRYAEMTETEAEALINKVLDYEEKSLALKKSFINDIKAVIPMTKVAKLEIIEREYKRKMLDRIRERYKERSSRKDRKE